MEVIDQVNLAANNAAGLMIRDQSHTLPGGIFVLPVSNGSESWRFECRSLGDNRFYIKGSEWYRFFAGARVDDMVTLYTREEGDEFHRVEVVRSA